MALKTCDYVFIAIAVLFVGALIYKVVDGKKNELFTATVAPAKVVEFEETPMKQIEPMTYDNGQNFFGMIEANDEIQEPEVNEPFKEDIFASNGACLPASMSDEGANDSGFEVYDRQIGQITKSRNYDQGDKFRGDLKIAPARPTDSYGNDWFRPANTNGSLNAGAMRFIAAGNNDGYTSIHDDDLSNMDRQYA
jgi:hypothetical protein